MNLGVKIAGNWNKVNDIPVGGSQLFDGAGNVRCSTLSRTSKNRYKIYVALDSRVVEEKYDSLRRAVDGMQSVYNQYGSLISTKKPRRKRKVGA